MDELTGWHWGRWQLDKEKVTLTWIASENDKYRRKNYELDLKSMTSSTKMLKAIMEVPMLSWIDGPDDLGQLIEALDMIFSPQDSLCCDKTLTPEEISKMVKFVGCG